MIELELSQEIKNAIETGFDENGMRYTPRHAFEFVRQLRRHKFSDEKITEMMTSSPMLKDEDDPQAQVRSALFILDANERTQPIIDEGDWTGASNKFVDLSWPHLVHHNGEALNWDGAAYVPVADSTIHSSGRMFLGDVLVRKMTPAGPNETRCRPNNKAVGELVGATYDLRHVPGSVPTPSWFGHDARPPAAECIGFRNGVLHTKSKGFISPNPEFFTRNGIDFDYDPSALVPLLWLATLKQYWPNPEDRDCIDALQEWFGLLLTADTSFQKILLLLGPLRSGKGLLGRIIAKLVGKLNVVATTPAALGGQFGMEPLIAKLVAIVGETKIGASRWNDPILETTLLNVSGEDPVGVNRKGRMFWNGTLSTRFILMANELPRFADNGGALGNRMVIIPMTNSFLGVEDRTLETRIEAELPAIMNWGLVGLDRLLKQGRFTEPRAGLTLKRQMILLASPVKSFVEAHCEFEPTSFVEKDALYLRWKEHCMTNGEQRPGDKDVFCRDLLSGYVGKIVAARATITRPDRTTKIRVNVFEGIRLRPLNEPEKVMEPEQRELPV
jgi:P4 family phage/plasmid primase-like protien